MADPPAPRRFAQPSFLAIEEALRNVPFPISKAELVAELEDETVLVAGENRDLAQIIRDLHDDFFDTEEEVHLALERSFRAAFDGEVGEETAPPAPGAAWNDPGQGEDRGRADWSRSTDLQPPEGR